MQVLCDVLAMEPEERQSEQAADFSKVLAAQIADADAAQVCPLALCPQLSWLLCKTWLLHVADFAWHGCCSKPEHEAQKSKTNPDAA